MKRYKPIEGLLGSRRRKGAPWSWVAVPTALSLALLIYILAASNASEPPAPSLIDGHSLGAEIARGSMVMASRALSPTSDKASDAVDPDVDAGQAPQEDELPLIEGAPLPALAPTIDPAPPADPAAPDVGVEVAGKPAAGEPEAGEPAEESPDGPAGDAPEAADPPAEVVEAKQDPKAGAEPARKMAAIETELEPRPPEPEVKKPDEPKADPKRQVVEGKEGAFEGKLSRGQSLYAALVDLRFSRKNIQPAIDALGKVVDFKRSRPGDFFAVKHDKQGQITELRYRDSPERIRLVKLNASTGAYASDQESVPVQTEILVKGGTVSTSLYVSMRDLGFDHITITRFTDIFTYDFDFASDTKPGDTYKIAIEKIYIDGRFIRNGRIMAAEYKSQKERLRAYRYGDTTKEYFDASGKSLKRMFMKAPVKMARMTSKFGKRFHPILKRWMLHAGVDYAAPTGTPIMSVADGEVSFIGPKGANGNLIVITHSNGLQSLYAHLSRFASKLKKGDKVSQGQVIGYIGSTGRSTGPHLHLAVKDPKQGFIDPLSVKSTRGAALKGADLRKFRVSVNELDRQLNKVKVQGQTRKAVEEPTDLNGTDSE